MRKVSLLTSIAAGASIAILVMSTGTASASPSVDTFDELLNLNSGVTATEMREAVAVEAIETGESEEQVIAAALAKAKTSILPGASAHAAPGASIR